MIGSSLLTLIPFYSHLILSCLCKKHPSDIIHPHPHVLRQRVNLQPDQCVAALLQTITDLRLIQRDHRDLYPRPPKIVALSQGSNEQEVATGAQEPPNVAQGPGEGGQVWADALQTEAGHKAVGPSWRKGVMGQRLRAVHVDGEDVRDDLP